MTLKEFLKTNEHKNYVITDRVRLPIANDIIKYLEVDEITVTNTEVKNDTLYVYTDYIGDSC